MSQNKRVAMPWDHILKSLKDSSNQTYTGPMDTSWLWCYNDGTRNLLLNHNEAELEDVLQAFEDFCKGAGFVFDGFAIVDEDGIPVNGLSSIAKLEADPD